MRQKQVLKAEKCIRDINPKKVKWYLPKFIKKNKKMKKYQRKIYNFQMWRKDFMTSGHKEAVAIAIISTSIIIILSLRIIYSQLQ